MNTEVGFFVDGVTVEACVQIIASALDAETRLREGETVVFWAGGSCIVAGDGVEFAEAVDLDEAYSLVIDVDSPEEADAVWAALSADPTVDIAAFDEDVQIVRRRPALAPTG